MAVFNPNYNLVRIYDALRIRLRELGGVTVLAIPCGKVDQDDHGVVVWFRSEDGAFITHRYFVNSRGKAALESGDYNAPGSIDEYQAIARGCRRAADLA